MDENIKKNILKTGTTILGIVCKDGVVMAGDRRVTLGGVLISSKNYHKVFPINEYIVYAGCGSAAETQKIAKLLAAELKLKELKTKGRPSVKQAASLLSNIQAQSSAFIIAGVDEDGKTSLYEVAGNFLKEVEDYTASLGSGMQYVLGLLERQYKNHIYVEEGVKLAQEALKSSTQRDPSSGNGLDVYTITKEGIKKVVAQKIEAEYKDE